MSVCPPSCVLCHLRSSFTNVESYTGVRSSRYRSSWDVRPLSQAPSSPPHWPIFSLLTARSSGHMQIWGYREKTSKQASAPWFCRRNLLCVQKYVVLSGVQSPPSGRPPLLTDPLRRSSRSEQSPEEQGLRLGWRSKSLLLQIAGSSF